MTAAFDVADLSALEILDSRGRPTLAVTVRLAASAGVPLWQWLALQGVAPSLPVPHFNVLNGGVHAPNALDFQEFMVAPVGAPSMAEAVRPGAEVYGALRRELSGRQLSTGLGDEGGFVPEVAEHEEVLRLLVRAISDAGYKTGAQGLSIALDLAASEFRQPDGRYQVAGDLMDPAHGDRRRHAGPPLRHALDTDYSGCWSTNDAIEHVGHGPGCRTGYGPP